MIEAPVLRDLWQSHAARLLLIARSMQDLASDEPVEDAVQEAFVAMATREALPEDPLAWLVRVTRNRLLQWRRKGSRRRARERSRDQRPWLDGATVIVDRKLDAAEATDALKGLPPVQREAIVMHLWGEMSFDAIAQATDTSRATAHRNYQRGLQTLRQRFGANASPITPMEPTKS